MHSAPRKHDLGLGSVLLREAYWRNATQYELKGLIKRFATRENLSRRRGKPSYLWRKRRLGAVAVYESRFERVPAVLRSHYLAPMRSYYVHTGRYVWPERGNPGDPVVVSTSRSLRNGAAQQIAAAGGDP
jgi:hypothetical protein